MLLPRRLLSATLAVTFVLGASSCSKDDDDEGRSARPATTTTAAAAGPPTIGVTVTGVDPHGTRAPDDATVAAVKATIDGWIATAVVGPLHSGQPAGDLSPLFTPAAMERITGDPAARAALVDEGMPPASKAITAERANVGLFSVAGPDEVVAVIGVQLDLKLRAVGPTMDVDVAHYGELVLVQEGGTWRIDTFAVEAARDSRA